MESIEVALYRLIPTTHTRNTLCRSRCACLTNFIWCSTSNPKCHMMFSKKNIKCQLTCTFNIGLHDIIRKDLHGIHLSCLLVQVTSIFKGSIDVWFFLHVKANFEMCVSIDMQFYIFLQVFACQMPKIGKDHTLVGVSMYREEHTRKKHGNFTWLTMFFSSVCQCFVCIFDKVFASSWHLTCRNLHTHKNARPLTHTI